MDHAARQRAWWEALPKTAVVAYAWISDAKGRVLLVKPTYKDCWLFPGGVVEHREDPVAGAQREVVEELGIHLTPLRLLTADSDAAFGHEDWPLLVVIVDFGTPAMSAPTLPADELSDWGWFTPDEARAALSEYDQHRFTAGLAALAR